MHDFGFATLDAPLVTRYALDAAALDAAVDAYWTNRRTPRAVLFPAAWAAEQDSRRIRAGLAR